MPTEKVASAATTRHPTPATWTSWCDSCHSIPSSVYCRADAAYLCTNCDSSIHSANSLARRHHRVPLLPIPAGGLIVGGISVALPKEEEDEEDPEEDQDGFLIGGEVDEYFDLVEFSTSCEEEGKEKYDCREEEEKQMLQSSFNVGEGFKGGIDYSAFLPHTESLSSIEGTVVPENSMISISSSQFRTSKETIELFSGPPIQVPQQFSPMDREARVLRYREKRKTRKFQKIIRYASRKAYAETRPRIKGRFAKRTDAELEVDQMFAAPVMVEAGYGVVHSY
ncbi:zinc finger protein CONSTANS-LIKE 2 [Dendrobium catenatum]|uniref:zinc finger protein CONSTANS-LIKE 2 n=1 Tax=Dendrobium catenatum TaxID=906689 RepID=UPI0009F4C85E|nr:zinc finger protein CONSTANS-LIKE 2 [Dendrobium catenatum]